MDKRIKCRLRSPILPPLPRYTTGRRFESFTGRRQSSKGIELTSSSWFRFNYPPTPPTPSLQTPRVTAKMDRDFLRLPARITDLERSRLYPRPSFSSTTATTTTTIINYIIKNLNRSSIKYINNTFVMTILL